MKGSTSIPTLTKNRLEALADGLFAIVMTLLVLELSIPVIIESSVDVELLRKLLELWPKILIYMLSFLVLGTLWSNHHFMFHYITRSDGRLSWMNIILLFCIIIGGIQSFTGGGCGLWYKCTYNHNYRHTNVDICYR
jgi:uncharacterized membrane protein